MTIKEVNRNISFASRNIKSSFRCKYGDKESFDILRINVSFEGKLTEIYEVDSKFLTSKDSIHFKAIPIDNGFQITGWTPAEVAPYVRKK